VNAPAVLAALAFQAASFITFAETQRRTLADTDVEVPFGRSLRIALAGNAVSATVPVVGPKLGFLYSLRSFSAAGASAAAAACALAVSGVMSSIAFAAVMLVGALISGRTATMLGGIVAAIVGVLPVVVVLLTLKHGRLREVLQRLIGWTGRRRLFARRLSLEPRASEIATFVDRVGDTRLRRDTLVNGMVLSTANWLLDLGCLVTIVAATGGPVQWRALPLAWAVICTASSLKFTPMGIGSMEATTAVGLRLVGLSAGQALTAAIVYRAVGTWLPVTAGWLLRPRSASNSSPLEPELHGEREMVGQRPVPVEISRRDRSGTDAERPRDEHVVQPLVGWPVACARCPGGRAFAPVALVPRVAPTGAQ
jgi:putative heme transporter